jgi:hypothetical protein
MLAGLSWSPKQRSGNARAQQRFVETTGATTLIDMVTVPKTFGSNSWTVTGSLARNVLILAAMMGASRGRYILNFVAVIC